MRHTPIPAPAPTRLRDIHGHPTTAATTIAVVDVHDHHPHTRRRWISL
ncbi:hypothetical protein [Nocardia pseudovaccinii]|nr:hypothetical protein [Nocardia pseudovaccinii]